MRALGKLPARENSVSLKFSHVFRADKLPTPPDMFGHFGLVGSAWGVLDNDQIGDCVWAGAAHETMIWSRVNANPASFSAANVVSDYAAVTGYDGTPDSDQGTDMQQAASYRQKTGIVDSFGVRHKIGAYMALERGNWDELMLAAWLFGAVGVGIVFPTSAEHQFDAHQPWTPILNSPTDGGHYVPVVGRNSQGNALVVTWGRIQAMTREFYEMYNDESIAYFSPEYVTPSKLSPEGFDAEALGNFLKELKS